MSAKGLQFARGMQRVFNDRHGLGTVTGGRVKERQRLILLAQEFDHSLFIAVLFPENRRILQDGVLPRREIAPRQERVVMLRMHCDHYLHGPKLTRLAAVRKRTQLLITDLVSAIATSMRRTDRRHSF